MKNITIKFIPHNKQIYDTVGNYGEKKNEIWFTISEMSDWRYEFLVLLHEMVEFFLVKLYGVKIEDIDNFDKEFERNRREGNIDEPGDDKDAPYHFQHQLASGIERMMGALLFVDYEAYDKEVMSL